MNQKRFTLLGMALFSAVCAFAQHAHPTAQASPLSFQAVRAETLTDPELKEYQMTSSVMTIAPGGHNAVPHRHDCELFGYVLEGAVEIGLDYQKPETFRAGKMFFEKRNIAHTLTRNVSPDAPAKVLLFFIIKNGRSSYTPIESDKH